MPSNPKPPAPAQPDTNRELDVRIQALLFPWNESRCRVCGWTFGDNPTQCHPGDCSLRPKPTIQADAAGPYSTDLNAAMVAYQAFREKLDDPLEEADVRLSLAETDLPTHDLSWEAVLEFDSGSPDVTEWGATPAEALCKAILAAAEVSNER